MIRFILKEYTEIEEKPFIVTLFSLVTSLLITFFCFSTYVPTKELPEISFSLALQYITLPFFFISCLIIITSFLVEIARKKIPYQKKIIYELGKKYEVHCFPIFNLEKYYYKGKLHREKDSAIVILNNINSSRNKYYLKGKIIEKEDFELSKLKNKVEQF
jgi:hypothetical protein